MGTEEKMMGAEEKRMEAEDCRNYNYAPVSIIFQSEGVELRSAGQVNGLELLGLRGIGGGGHCAVLATVLFACQGATVSHFT